MLQPGDEVLTARGAWHPEAVVRRGDVVLRQPTPWTPAVQALLRHIEASGIEAPRVVGAGRDKDGWEMLSYVPGVVDKVSTWSLEAAGELGRLLRRHHDCLASFEMRPEHVWYAWCATNLSGPTIIGHRDLGPWNIVRREGLPVAFIDWTRAGPIDPLVEVAHVCWLNAHLHDDVVAEAEHLHSIEVRAKNLRAIVDGYGVSTEERIRLVDLMVQVAVLSAADDADQSAVGRHTVSAGAPRDLVWALSWQIRGAAWMILNRQYLTDALL